MIISYPGNLSVRLYKLLMTRIKAMKITVTDNYKEQSELAASLMCNVIENRKNAVIGLPTGSTPLGMYKELIKSYNEGKISFAHVVTFNLDEYIGLPATDENSYNYYMNHNFFSFMDIDKKNINIPHGNTDDVTGECLRYEENIKAAGGMDIIFLGIGRNGHIGFNEPGEFFEPYTHQVILEKSTIDANSRFFGSVSKVPTSAITMGIKTILSARQIVLLASGKEKAEILKEALKGKITPKIPASILQLHEHIDVIADSEAAVYL